MRKPEFPDGYCDLLLGLYHSFEGALAPDEGLGKRKTEQKCFRLSRNLVVKAMDAPSRESIESRVSSDDGSVATSSARGSGGRTGEILLPAEVAPSVANRSQSLQKSHRAAARRATRSLPQSSGGCQFLSTGASVRTRSGAAAGGHPAGSVRMSTTSPGTTI